jgi:hypothetical protein
VRRFGGKARKIYLRDPPSVLQRLFVQVVEMGREDGPSNRSWKRRSEEEHGGGYGHSEEDFRAKRQMGQGAHAQGGHRFGGSISQEGWQGRRPSDPRFYNRAPQEQRRLPGMQDNQNQGGEPQEQTKVLVVHKYTK